MTMFPERPYRSEEERKQGILERSPFLKNLLDYQGRKLDIKRYSERISYGGDRFSDELEVRHGVNVAREAQKLLILAGPLNLFKTDFPDAARQNTMKNLLLVGYEIGDQDDVRLFTKDMFDAFSDTRITNLTSLNESVTQPIKAFYEGVMQLGVYFRFQNLASTQEGSLGALPPTSPFSAWIDGLDDDLKDI